MSSFCFQLFFFKELTIERNEGSYTYHLLSDRCKSNREHKQAVVPYVNRYNFLFYILAFVSSKDNIDEK